MDTVSTIVDRIASALDAQALIMMTGVIAAAESHFSEHATEEAGVDYLNMLEALAMAANNGLVGPVTAAEIASRVQADVDIIKRSMPGLIDKATLKPSDFCEIKAVLGRQLAGEQA